ncbi:3'-5' exonuclease [Chitiniphilus shinanonensis]|uniref:3'-5' exonuclease n=1 Tax=Chitiniphilus shinanonensis TaxID=553088 RepID=A0ABQ6BWL1_9NEIS|nr:3'-5' exonuclease [Chitiniphilus shinanonensis]GLS05792.1 3'-5' exonuclease [Chitiniphilus shinanonensis]
MRALFDTLRRDWHRRQLRDPDYAFLFDEEPPDEYVSLDCETTSLDPRRAELLAIAAVRVRGRRILSSERLVLPVQPEGDIDRAGIAIHAIRRQDAVGGLAARVALERLLRFIGPRPLIGYYLEFDLAVIDRLLRPWLGIGLPNRRIEVSSIYYDRHVSAYRPEVDLSLGAMLRGLQLPDLGRHDPVNDALMAAMIYLKLTQQPVKAD